MAWTRIDDKFLMNPKVQSAGVHGMALYLAGLIYCNSNLTDGFIPQSILPILYGMAFQTKKDKMEDRLVDLNLWELVEGGYQIHDFLKFNKSKHEIEILNRRRAINGAKGGRPANQRETDLLTKQDSKQVSKRETDLLTKQPPINPNTLIPNALIPKKECVNGESVIDKDPEHDTPLVSPVQRMLEVVTGLMPSNINDINALDEITAMNPTQADIKSAYDWYVGQGKKFRYYQSLVGPIKTAIAARIQYEL